MKIFIEYEVITSATIAIERDELPENPDDLLESVTRDELANSPDIKPIEWGHLKGAWRAADANNTYITNEDYDELY